MDRSCVKVLSIISILCLANWGSEETTTGGSKKLAVNFYGILKTWEGEEYDVDNIAIARTYKQIPFYEPPVYVEALEYAAELFNESPRKNKSIESDTLSNSHILKTNPVDGIITKIDLKNIKEIRTPNPDVIWTYQKGKNQSKQEFIEVHIISADNTKATYLMDIRRKVTCDLIRCKDGQAISQAEKDVPFKAIKRLVIEGHSDRDSSESSRVCRNKN